MMTKDEELAMDLALETLESIQAVYPCETVGKRITAIKQARSAPVQEPVAWVRLEAWKSGAEWPDDCFTDAHADGLVPLYTTPPAAQLAPMQEPVGWVNHANIASAVVERERGGSGDTHTWSESKTAYHTVPFYTTPQPQQAEKQEPVAWIDGGDLELMRKHGRGCIAWGTQQNNANTPLYTTPPAQPQQEPVVWMYVNKSTHETKFQKHMRDFVDHSLWSEVPLYGEPLANHEFQCVCGAVWCGDEMVHLPDKRPPAQRKPLTDEEIILIVADCASSHQHTDIHFARAIEAKLKEKNT